MPENKLNGAPIDPITHNAPNHDDDGGHGDDHQRGPIVEITVNQVLHNVHRGRLTVSEIKQAAGVPLSDDLEQVVSGKLVPLPDDGSIRIKGGEVFISHPKDAASS